MGKSGREVMEDYGRGERLSATVQEWRKGGMRARRRRTAILAASAVLSTIPPARAETVRATRARREEMVFMV